MAFNLHNVEFIDCYDGDTCKFNILDHNFPNYLNPMSIRVYGVDTAEMSSNSQQHQQAIKGKLFTINFIKHASALKLINCSKDKYFRFDCVYQDGNKNLAQELINNHLGTPYFGGKKS